MKTFSATMSAQVQHSSKIWIYSTSITIFVIVASATVNSTSNPNINDIVTFLGFPLPLHLFYPIACALLASLSIAFACAEIQHRRTAAIFQDYLSGLSGPATNKYTLVDVGHSLYISPYNRIYPITHLVTLDDKKFVYKTVKFPVDLAYYLLPIFGACVSFYQTFNSSGWRLWSIYSFVLLFLVAISVGIKLLNWLSGQRWLMDAGKNMGKT